MLKLKKTVLQFDWFLIVPCFLISIIGIISIYSSNSSFLDNSSLIDGKLLYLNQFIFLLISILIVFVICRLPIYKIINFSFIFYLIGVIFLIITLIFGTTYNQSKSWLDLGFFSIQVSEFMKIAFILFLSFFYARKSNLRIKDLFLAFIIFLIPFVLIMLQPDFGTGVVFGFIWLIITLSINIKLKYKISLISGMILLTLVVGLLINSQVLEIASYQKERMKIYPDHLFLDNIYHEGIGYQVDQSLIAIGSGGFMGKGLGNGSQTQLRFLPERESDFIFSSISEELGIITILIIFALYIFLMWKIYNISTLNVPSSIYFVIIGIISMISFHIIQNIGMNIGLLPVTGIPLPFISLGGSFLLTCFICIGLLESIVLQYKSK